MYNNYMGSCWLGRCHATQVACFNITVFTLIPTGTNLASLHKTVLYYVMTKPIRMRRSIASVLSDVPRELVPYWRAVTDIT